MMFWISYELILIADGGYSEPANVPSERHIEQGFSRTASQAVLYALVESAPVTVTPSGLEEIARCQRVTSLSLLARTGRVTIGSVDPEDATIWTGRPGWVRVTIGQRMAESPEDANPRAVDLLYHVEEAACEQPSLRFEDGVSLPGPFDEGEALQ